MTSLLEKFTNRYGRLPTEVDPDYLEMLRMSKYRILDLPDLNPAKCANCGGHKADGRKYIDFGLLVDWYGTVYLCSYCIKELATQLGFIKLDENVEISPLLVLEEDVDITIGKLEQVLKGFYEYSNKLRVDNSPDAVEHDPDDANSLSTGEQGTDKTEQGVTEQDSSVRRTNVRSLTELLNDPK